MKKLTPIETAFWILWGIWLLYTGWQFIHTPGLGIGDPLSYVKSAESIVNQGFFPGNWYQSGFGYSLLIALVHQLGFTWEMSAKTIALVLGAASIPLVAYTMKLFFKREEALLFVFPMFFTSEYIVHSITGHVGTVLLFFLYAGLWATEKVSKNVWISHGSFKLVGFSLWTRFSHALFLPYFVRKWAQQKKWKEGLVYVLFFLLLLGILSYFNERNDTGLSQVPLTSYMSVFIPHLMWYAKQLILLFPFTALFLWMIPRAVQREKFIDMAWWSIPYLLGLFIFPLGINVYYLFPILPFFLVACFLAGEKAIHSLSFLRPHVRTALLFLLFLQFLWLIPQHVQVEQTKERHLALEEWRGFVTSTISTDDLLILGYEAQWLDPILTQKEYQIVYYPGAISKLYNGMDQTPVREHALEQISSALSENQKIYISSLVLSLSQSPYCEQLNCIPAPSSEKKLIYSQKQISLYELEK